MTAKTFAAAVPAFVGGFLAMAAVRTLGDAQLAVNGVSSRLSLCEQAVRTLGDAQLANGGSALFAFDSAQWKGGADWLGAVLGAIARDCARLREIARDYAR